MGAPLANGGRVKHINGTATVTAAKTEFQATESSWLSIFNADATNNLLVSFDGGTLFTTVRPTTRLEGPFAVKQLSVKSSAATVAYEILHTSVV